MGGAEETPHARRAMFRLGLKRLVEPLAGYLEERLDLRLPVSRSILRPPGALPERSPQTGLIGPRDSHGIGPTQLGPLRAVPR